MLAKGLERVFVVVYTVLTIVFGILFWAHDSATECAVFLAGAVGLPPLILPWLRRQIAAYPVSTTICAAFLLFGWMGAVNKHEIVPLLLALPAVGAAWIVRGFSRKETPDGSV